MVSFTALTTAISMAILATTASAAPAEITARQPPPTWSFLDLSLYKTNQVGAEKQYWGWAGQGHLSPSDLVKDTNSSEYYSSSYNGVDFYNLKIDYVATGYNCHVKVYEDPNCSLSSSSSIYYNPDYYEDCLYPASTLITFKS
ncbi:hypothetical protein DL98DRAFT_586712 [Cadophora sp. DSE1049]|nr:hypothetical protein DL98DRAFT_586712 [Cadophora sp. DSE1049]